MCCDEREHASSWLDRAGAGMTQVCGCRLPSGSPVYDNAVSAGRARVRQAFGIAAKSQRKTIVLGVLRGLTATGTAHDTGAGPPRLRSCGLPHAVRAGVAIGHGELSSCERAPATVALQGAWRCKRGSG